MSSASRCPGKTTPPTTHLRQGQSRWTRPGQRLSFNRRQALPEIRQRLVQQRRSFGLAHHAFRCRAQNKLLKAAGSFPSRNRFRGRSLFSHAASTTTGWPSAWPENPSNDSGASTSNTKMPFASSISTTFGNGSSPRFQPARTRSAAASMFSGFLIRKPASGFLNPNGRPTIWSISRGCARDARLSQSQPGRSTPR